MGSTILQQEPSSRPGSQTLEMHRRVPEQTALSGQEFSK